jgi:hypothetical protein
MGARSVKSGARAGAPRPYAIAIPAAFFQVWISCGLYVLVALVWLVPDRRIERVLSQPQEEERGPQADRGDQGQVLTPGRPRSTCLAGPHVQRQAGEGPID